MPAPAICIVLHKASGTRLTVSQKSVDEGEYPDDEYDLIEGKPPAKKTKKPEGG